MDETIQTFLAVTGIDDKEVATHFLELTNGDLEYAVTLFMESDHHHATAGATSTNDEELAQRLQNEAYSNQQQDEVRAADTNVHRHETLVDSFGGPGFDFLSHMQQRSRPADIFGAGRAGPFNQRFDELENDYYNSRASEISDEDDDEYVDEEYNDATNDDDEDDDDIMELDANGDVVETTRPMSRRRRLRGAREEELTSTQRRLANLFRPPFEIMSLVNLDEAKQKGKEENKWILINIQDPSEFKSHILNRDFWSNEKVKAVVKESFVFLQFQSDSPNGINYLNFYSTDDFPHIAILDPLTGERVFKWKDGEVPKVDAWIEDIDEFLEKFSLLAGSNNPMVKHEVKFDPEALTEEQQIEFALKQSILENEGKSAEDAIDLDESDSKDVSAIEETEEQGEEQEQDIVDPFDRIIATNHDEPTAPPSTRVQIRFPNGKRLVHKFKLDDTVLEIFQWIKYILSQSPDEYGLSSNDRFSLSDTSQKSFKFIESLDTTIEKANLKNASILLEKE
ncbi:uncharacterized protein RJT20DRAFT_116550 [Scheffersomyces xylosifermentans]|uniref:uncharacterized protein n=1 Tax=Scheffersomyces xylosifermentans TaxID=1304137 RepID=UPI00315C7C5F